MLFYKALDYILPGENITVRKTLRNLSLKDHTHDFIELVYIVNGKGRHFVNNVGYDVQKGDMIYIGIHDTHAFESFGNIEIVEFFVKPEFISDQLKSDSPADILTLSIFKDFSTEIDYVYPYVSFRGRDLVEVEFIVQRIMDEHKRKIAGYLTVIKGYFHVLLASLLREIRKSNLYNIDSHVEKLMPEILQYIEENCFEKISLTQLAEKCFYNPAYFSRIFKETFGKTLIEYVTERRIREAVRLLEETQSSIEEICNKIGYGDTKHFYKVFKEKMGTTPGKYRRENKKTTHKSRNLPLN